VRSAGGDYLSTELILQSFYLSNMSGNFAQVVASPSLDQSGGSS
jgi:hypothetical protein